MKYLNKYNSYIDFVSDVRTDSPKVSVIESGSDTIIGYKKDSSYEFFNKSIMLDNFYISMDEITNIYSSMKECIGGLVDDIDNQICIYGRMGRYNDMSWSIAGGNIDSSVKSLFDEKFSFFQSIQVIQLPNGDTLDAPHFWAVLNTLFKGTGDLGGWAGDLVEFAKDLKSDSNAIFPSGEFNYEDWCSDADAYNIYKLYNGNILSGLRGYFKSDLTNAYRKSQFKTDESILVRYSNSPNSMLLGVLANKYGVSSDDISLAANKMQEYLDN